MSSHQDIANLIFQTADLLRGPYRPPQYERVMLPMTVLRRFDCVLAPTKDKVLAAYKKNQAKPKPLTGEALDKVLSNAAGQRFNNHSPLDFAKLKGDPDHIDKHLVSYINGFSANVRRIFDFFEFGNEIERMRESNVSTSSSPSLRMSICIRTMLTTSKWERPSRISSAASTSQRNRRRPLHAPRSHPPHGQHDVRQR